MLLSTCFGFENFADASAKSYVFFVPAGRYAGEGKEVFLSQAAKLNLGIRRHGPSNTFPAAPGLRPETGRWTQCTYDVPDGMLLKIFASRNGGFGQMRAAGTVYLIARTQGPLTRVETVLTGNPRASFQTAVVEGRFDVVDLQTIQANGVEIPAGFQASCQPEMVRRMFNIRQMEPQTSSLPTITVVETTNSEGESVQIKVPRKGRALDI